MNSISTKPDNWLLLLCWRLVRVWSVILYHGKWVYNSTGPLYSNNSCPVLSQMQNCQGNGRPDKEYENWRWTPTHCDVPRFDATKFLELMRGKTIAYIGDSVARNQMESLLCILWQASNLTFSNDSRMLILLLRLMICCDGAFLKYFVFIRWFCNMSGWSPQKPGKQKNATLYL